MSTNTEKTLERYTAQGEIAGAVVLVRQDGKLVKDFACGYADRERQIAANKTTLFRLASMSKPITGIAVMQLAEQNRLSLHDPVRKFIPAFAQLRVCKNGCGNRLYVPDPNRPAGETTTQELLDRVEYEPAQSDITVLQLLSHCSGLGMGPVGNAFLDRLAAPEDTILQRAEKYARLPLDFQPGTGSGYSGRAAFEVLAAIVEIVSGQAFSEYLDRCLFRPLGIRELGFVFTPEQQSRIPRLYQYENGGLTDVSDTDVSWRQMDPLRQSYFSGSAGMLGSVEEYEKIAHMLLNGGTLDGVSVLKPETVLQMAGKGIPHTSVLRPGVFWGLSMCVFDAPEAAGSARAAGSYGWSGAYGTHFFVDPLHRLEVVLGVNRSNIGGAASPVSAALEAAVRADLFPLG